MSGLTRRAALAAIAQLAAAASLAGCSMGSDDTASSGGNDVETLASVAYDLFPYDNLEPAVYVKAAEAIIATGDPMVADGLKQLSGKVNAKRWKDVPEAGRIAALTSLQDSDFFALIRSTSANVLYNNPAVWEIVGYGGPALEKGGYINRGFNDVSWLPESGGN